MDIAKIDKILQNTNKLHFIGVGGSGMYPIVQIMLSKGYKISGSDVNEGDILNYERGLGVDVMMGHRAENIQDPGLVVYSAAIRADNPERLEAERRGIPCVERSIMLGYVSGLYNHALCIAGTHGKTTATGMSVQILEMAGLDPAAVIGGRLPLIKGYGKSGSGGIVVEACEYHNTFHELTVETAVLLNVDNDHLEFFGSMDNLKAAFRKFCALASRRVVYNGDDENSRQVVEGLEQKLVSFGTGENSDLRAVNLREYTPGYWAFCVQEKTESGLETSGEIQLGAPGMHNVYNALAAYAGAGFMGASHSQCAEGLLAFKGTGRRFEILGQRAGVTVADDYAHHPTEVKAVLSAAKEMDYTAVWAVHQPYTYSRTGMLLDDFAKVLPIADHVVLTAIMGGRERAEDYDVTTADLADKIPGCVWFETQQQAADYVAAKAKAGELVVTLGCGDIYKCARMILEKP